MLCQFLACLAGNALSRLGTSNLYRNRLALGEYLFREGESSFEGRFQGFPLAYLQLFRTLNVVVTNQYRLRSCLFYRLSQVARTALQKY